MSLFLILSSFSLTFLSFRYTHALEGEREKGFLIKYIYLSSINQPNTQLPPSESSFISEINSFFLIWVGVMQVIAQPIPQNLCDVG